MAQRFRYFGRALGEFLAWEDLDRTMAHAAQRSDEYSARDKVREEIANDGGESWS